jgi:hypothetical protein
MRCHLPDADLNEANVFRVGSERALYPANYVEATLLSTPPGKTEWVTLNVYARELAETDNPNPLPIPRDQVINTGYHSTQIRATFNIDNEKILVGIGGGVRLSVPANSDVSVGIAVPGVPRNAYALIPNWPNNPMGVQVQVGAAIPAQTLSPFPMPFLGGDPPLAAYTTTILATMKTCRVPVGDRLARLSQEVWAVASGGRGGLSGTLVEVPARARKISIYDTATTLEPLEGALYAQFRGAYFVDAMGNPTPDGPVIASLYPQTMIHDFTLPTNATHLVVRGSTGGEDPGPAKINLTWTLEF